MTLPPRRQNENGFYFDIVSPPENEHTARDVGKLFLITEWPAELIERWGMAMIAAASRGNADLDLSTALGRGMEFIFWAGMQSLCRGKIDADELVPLLDRLLNCVKIIRDPNARNKETGDAISLAQPLIQNDIMEVATRWWLRSEVIRVHTNFSPQEVFFAFLDRVWSAEGKAPKDSPTTPTSPQQ